MAERDDPQSEPEDPALAVAARHALHDEELIAAFSVDGDDSDDPARARGLIDRCTACRELHVDLVGIHRVLRGTGNAAAVAATRPAPRDFRLSAATANRLRPGSVVLRLRDRIALAFRSFGRPLGMSMAALGVVGLLLGSLTLGGGTALGPAAEDIGMTNAAATSTPATDGLSGPAGTPGSSERTSGGPAANASPETASTPAPVGGDSPGAASAGPAVSIAILGGSIVLLVAGFFLFILGSRREGTGSGRMTSDRRDAAREPS